jgi:hypothetical protein
LVVGREPVLRAVARASFVADGLPSNAGGDTLASALMDGATGAIGSNFSGTTTAAGAPDPETGAATVVSLVVLAVARGAET